MTTKNNYDIVIGIEIHVQLKTQSKLFSPASTTFGAKPNTQACALDVAMPGTLPVLNREVLTHAARLGFALNADIAPTTIFARKNYFYPDLPKGYQISQLDHPIVGNGSIDITLDDGSKKTINITRAHLEEDAGKSVHNFLPGQSGIDLNRAGTPLLEIVSEPDMSSIEEAVAYTRTMHQLVRFLKIGDGNMQEGSFRADINISLKPKGSSTLGTRTEIKNLNSFRFIARAIEYEVKRQSKLLDKGERILQETLLYDVDKDQTKSMRSKEDAHDYRYFADPDLLPVTIDQAWLNEIKKSMPEMPDEKKHRYIKDYALTEDDASWLSQDLARAHYFEQAIQNEIDQKIIKNIVSWLKQELMPALNKNNLSIEQSPIPATELRALVNNIANDTISTKIAKIVFQHLWEQQSSVTEIIEHHGFKQMDDQSELQRLIDQLLIDFPQQAQEYRDGKTKMRSFFIGQIMKQTKGQANPATANALLSKALDS